jgi:hypothetical protein
MLARFDAGKAPLQSTPVDFSALVSQAGEDAELGFTESAEIIYLRRDDDLVVVSSSNRPVKGSVAREELLSEFIRFLRVAYHRLVTEVPGLSENPIIRRFSPDEVFRS